FYTLSGLAFAYCLCIGARVTADCVSEEKRDGTLGLLFLTDLKGFDVVFGKLAASSLNSIYGLLAVLPLLAIPLVLGGVTLLQFGAMVLVLCNALFFSLSLGIFTSALSRNDRKASFATLCLVFAPALIPFAVVFFMIMVWEWVQNPSDIAQLLPMLMFNPIYPYVVSVPSPLLSVFRPPDWTFWVSVGSIHAASWMLLLVTALVLPVVWKDRPKVVRREKGPGWVERWRRWARGNTAQRKALRDRLMERNPFLWLVSRDRLKPGYAWFFLCSMIAVWLWGYIQYGDVMFDFYPLVPTLFMIHSFLKVWVVTEVSYRFVEDQRNGAAELLLSTPLTMAEIRAGQQLAILRQFAWPVVAMCALEVIVFRTTFPLGQILPLLVMFVADLGTLTWLAMRLSENARSINQVLAKSLFWVLIMPWAVYVVIWPFWRWAVARFAHGVWPEGFTHRIYFWLAVGLLTDAIVVLGWARPDLSKALVHGIRRCCKGREAVEFPAKLQPLP
ncbi:MAG: ABC transporter permease subunit, partial [Verrucomicrobiota bacterium]